MNISDDAITLITSFEGLSLKPYRDVAGLWTVGIGTLIGDGHSLPDSWNRTFTVGECYALFRAHIKNFEQGVGRYISHALTQHQFDALVCFAYNVGLGTLQRSQIRQKINRGDMDGATRVWLQYNKARVKGVIKEVNGLTRRRKAEVALFNRG